MSDVVDPSSPPAGGQNRHPFRRAVLRGLGVLMPPLLTVVLFLWAWSLIETSILQPLERNARQLITWMIWDARVAPPDKTHLADYREVKSGQWIPTEVYQEVNANPGEQQPQTAQAYYERYVELRYLRRLFVLPLFLSVFTLSLYLLGKFLAAGVGRWLWGLIEALIQRLPIVRNVYSSVKQVTDLVFSEQELQFNRVVAVEYPRKGIWSLAFVVSDGMLDIRAAANEPVVTVLVPTSPMPATGFAVTVKKSETIDLNVTLDQAVQFLVSCGVVIPPQQHYTETGSGRVVPRMLAAPSAPADAAPALPDAASGDAVEQRR